MSYYVDSVLRLRKIIQKCLWERFDHNCIISIKGRHKLILEVLDGFPEENEVCKDDAFGGGKIDSLNQKAFQITIEEL